MADQTPGSPGRKLRLMRRKVLLDQAGLAKLLDTDVATISKMENNAEKLTPKAEAFLANPPTPVKARPARAAAKKKDPPAPAPEPPPEVEVGVPDPDAPRAGDGPGPAAPEDAPPKASPRPKVVALPRAGEIADLEAALLKMFAGESFLVPKAGPDGSVIQVEAVIPGIAQVVGMVDEFDGMVIQTYAPGMARAWAELARENATVRKILMGVTYGGAYRGVLAATLPAALAILAHHGALGLGAGPAVVEHRPQGGEPLVDERVQPIT